MQAVQLCSLEPAGLACPRPGCPSCCTTPVTGVLPLRLLLLLPAAATAAAGPIIHNSFFLWKNFFKYQSCAPAEATQTASATMLNTATRVLVSSAATATERPPNDARAVMCMAVGAWCWRVLAGSACGWDQQLKNTPCDKFAHVTSTETRTISMRASHHMLRLRIR